MKKKDTLINLKNIISFNEGLDISITLSLIPFISIHFLDHIESRLALIITTSVVISTYFFKPFTYFFINFLTRNAKLICLYLVPLSYFIPTLLNENFFILGIIFLSINRIIVSVNSTLANLPISNSIENDKNKNLRFWMFFILGSLFGVLIIYILNEFFSNSSMSDWAWKVGFYILTLLSFIGIKLNPLIYNLKDVKIINSLNTFKIKSIFKDINLILPIILIFLFCVEDWLPNNVTAENRLISEVKFINIIFMLMVIIFLHFLFKLLVRSNFYMPFLFTSALFFLCTGLLGTFNSNTSVEISNFFLTSISCICITFFGFELFKDKKNADFKYFMSLSVPLFFVSLIFPLYLYFLMFDIINYNLIFILLFIFFILNFLTNSIIIKKH